MSGAEFRQLVENLKIDGELTSTPLVIDGTVRSGNHRVQAAIEAGIEEAWVLELVTRVDENRAIGLQLSHNAITGKDDPSKLAKLYSKLDFTWKQYSGITDDVFKGLKELDLGALGLRQPDYQELVVLFLPEDQERFLRALEKIQKRLEKGTSVVAGRFEDFDQLFDAIVAVKKVRGIHNTAIALRTLAEIALGVLEAEAAAHGEKQKV
jgi:hypothetical protein